MTGLAVLVGYLIYLIFSIFMVAVVVRWAKRRGRRIFLWGLLTVLVMYHIPFWDIIPTLVVYKHYCKTKSGFWVYKTPEQWKVENPGVAETLTWSKRAQFYNTPNITQGYRLNERIVWVIIDHRTPIIPVTVEEELFIDVKTDEPLVRRVQIYSGRNYRNIIDYVKGWARKSQDPINPQVFNTLLNEYKTLGKETQ